MKSDFACTERDVSKDFLDRVKGCLYGVALGDALGATVEFMSQAEIKHFIGIHDEITGGGWLHLKPGQVTDDTEMTLCIARSLVREDRFNLISIAEEFTSWLSSGPVDVGSTCSQGIQRYLLKGQTEMMPSRWHAGNGACMRMAPVAIATFGDDSELHRQAISQAHLTHNNPLSDEACIFVGKMVHAGLGGEPLKKLLSLANDLVSEYSEFSYLPYPGTSSGYIAETISTVLHYFFYTNSFEACLIGVVNQGGDADTNGAIAGMIAGAYYGFKGLPHKWLDTLNRDLAQEIEGLSFGLTKMALSNNLSQNLKVKAV